MSKVIGDMADRKAELERKKEKLRAIREEKARRQQIKDKEIESQGKNIAKSASDIQAETDILLSELGIRPPNEQFSSISPPNESDQSLLSTPEPSLTSLSSSLQRVSLRRKPNLTVVNVHQTNIIPKEQVTYNKQTQTATAVSEREAHPLDYYVLVYDDVPGDDDEGSSLPTMDASPPTFGHRGHSGMPHVEMVKPAQTINEDMMMSKQEEKPAKKVIQELSEEKKQQLLTTDGFQRFFDHASRVVERALCEDANILIDYSGGDGEEKEGDDKSGIHLSLNRYFSNERWSKNRCVTCLDWSTQYPELLVASYSNNEDSPNEPDGVALVWNMKFKKDTPEYIFHCQSSVMSATFAKFHPNLIIGGTYSGQIVLWDNRSNKRTPIQRSPLSAGVHTHPVYCVKVVGTQNAHNLVSISTDGKLCTWSLDMLSVPQDTMELHKQSKAVAVTCLSFPAGDVNNFIIGSEEGTVFSACRHGTQAGIFDMYEGHQGPVTGIDTHNAQGPVDFSHLFLTSSFDWTVKLWSLREKKPLYSFEDYGDYVYDISWSPVHPSLFASVDGTGGLDLWNLNNDTEAPSASVVVDGSPALNRVSWSQSGHQVIAGDDMGKVWIYDVGEQLANPRNDEWNKFVHTLQEIKNNQADEDIVDGSYTSSPMSSFTPMR